MALSEQEQKLLREIEESLMADDPKFGSSVASAPERGSSGGGFRPTMRAVALIVLGLVLLISGVALAAESLWFIALSILGFVVMFIGGVWGLRAPSDIPPATRSKSAGPQPRREGRGSRMEENFRRRFEGQ